MGGEWFQTTYNVPDEAKKRYEFDPTKFLRFFVPRGGSKIVVILDESDPVCFFEHHPVVGNVYDLFFTCVKGVPGYDECPGCNGGDRRYWVGMHTCLDLTPFKKRDGTVVQWKRQVLPAKAIQLEMFKRQKEKRGTLRFARYEAMRSESKQSARIGDSWDFERHVTKEELLSSLPGITEADLQPFDYAELFKPKKVDEMRAMLHGQRPSDGVPISDEDVDCAAEAEDIPF